MADWPPGVRPRGRGLEIRIWRKGALAWSEALPGDLGPRHIAAAVKRRADLVAKVRLGISLHDEDTQGTQTFPQAAQSYLATLEAKRSTAQSYMNILNRYWIPWLENSPIDQISHAEIRRILAMATVSSKTKKNLLIPVRGVFDFVEVSPNPAAGIRLKRHQKPRVERYLPYERDGLLGELKGQNLAYFALLFGTGLRPGEALGLTWPDYDGEEVDVNKQITRRKLEPTTKTSERRRVYVPSWVRPHINALPSRFARGHIFLNSFDRPWLDTDTFNEAWAHAHKKLNIRYRIPYTCRHTRAAELLSAGIEIADSARQMGHSVEMFLRTYSEFIEEYAKDKDRSRFDISPHKRRTTKANSDVSD